MTRQHCIADLQAFRSQSTVKQVKQRLDGYLATIPRTNLFDERQELARLWQATADTAWHDFILKTIVE